MSDFTFQKTPVNILSSPSPLKSTRSNHPTHEELIAMLETELEEKNGYIALLKESLDSQMVKLTGQQQSGDFIFNFNENLKIIEKQKQQIETLSVEQLNTNKIVSLLRSENSKLTDELSCLSEDIQNKTRTIDGLTEQVELLEREGSDYKNIALEHESATEELTKEFENASKLTTLLNANLKTVQRERDELKDENATLQSKLDVLMEYHKTTQQEMEELTNKFRNATALTEKFSVENGELTKERDELLLLQNDLVEMNEKLSRTNETLEQANESLKESLRQCKLTAKEKEAELSFELSQEKQRSTQVASESARSLESLKQAELDNIARITALEQELSEEKQRFNENYSIGKQNEADWRKEKEQLMQLIKECSDGIEKMKSVNDKIHSDFNELSAESKTWKEQSKALQSSLQQSQENESSFQSRLSIAISDISFRDEQILQLRNENKLIIDELLLFRESVAEQHEKERARLESLQLNLDERNYDLDETIKKLNESEKKRSDLIDLSNENARLKEQISQLTNDHTQIRQDLIDQLAQANEKEASIQSELNDKNNEDTDPGTTRRKGPGKECPPKAIGQVFRRKLK
ncbi:hypothetical protein BLNAU_105 [Blattamonas nauphoetae]|uniref:Uncharacterized protein n=1 Tax=Blattamonas nauphoetae TaxID=2049346 RepID=A0ABQ9YMD8_9EUKA|nr:hypothetical protein BLNAU_105 [Blattamonas nauphoetae]